MSETTQKHSGPGHKIGGDNVGEDKIGRDKNTYNIGCTIGGKKFVDFLCFNLSVFIQ
jgi:hypothetical protein